MIKKRNTKMSTNIYWETVENHAEKLKNVILPDGYQQPGDIINSTTVQAETKPWLKPTKPRKPKENIKHQQPLPLVTQMIKKSPAQVSIKEMDCSPRATLKDLCKEDKQKISKLIQELAKFGEEKENAIEMLNKTKTKYKKTFQNLVEEKRLAIKEQDILKEKILEYEIYLKEQECQTNSIPEQSVHDKHNIFVQQQKKFCEQQDILQQQIEQLHKLQESLVEQQQKQLAFSINLHDNYEEKTVLLPTKLSSLPFNGNCSKLNQYIFDTETKRNCNSIDSSFHKTEVEEKGSNPDHYKENTSDIPLTDTAVHQANGKTDVCIQTENLSTQINDSCSSSSETIRNEHRLEQCEKTISLLEQSLSNAISVNSQKNTKISLPIQDQSIMTRSFAQATPSGRSQLGKSNSRSILATSEKRNLPKSSRKKKQSNSLDVLKTLFDESLSNSDEVITDIPGSIFASSELDRLTNSAVHRKHFKPSSILDLAAGLLPPSTSTSVDQYSVNRKVNDYKSLDCRKDKNSQMKNVYCHQKASPNFKIDGGSNGDIDEDELDILGDIFFVVKK